MEIINPCEAFVQHTNDWYILTTLKTGGIDLSPVEIINPCEAFVINANDWQILTTLNIGGIDLKKGAEAILTNSDQRARV